VDRKEEGSALMQRKGRKRRRGIADGTAAGSKQIPVGRLPA
jgi:hypothetical protein